VAHGLLSAADPADAAGRALFVSPDVAAVALPPRRFAIARAAAQLPLVEAHLRIVVFFFVVVFIHHLIFYSLHFWDDGHRHLVGRGLHSALFYSALPRLVVPLLRAAKDLPHLNIAFKILPTALLLSSPGTETAPPPVLADHVERS
jgi:hypothetical protein